MTTSTLLERWRETIKVKKNSSAVEDLQIIENRCWRSSQRRQAQSCQTKWSDNEFTILGWPPKINAITSDPCLASKSVWDPIQVFPFCDFIPESNSRHGIPYAGFISLIVINAEISSNKGMQVFLMSPFCSCLEPQNGTVPGTDWTIKTQWALKSITLSVGHKECHDRARFSSRKPVETFDRNMSMWWTKICRVGKWNWNLLIKLGST